MQESWIPNPWGLWIVQYLLTLSVLPLPCEKSGQRICFCPDLEAIIKQQPTSGTLYNSDSAKHLLVWTLVSVRELATHKSMLWGKLKFAVAWRVGSPLRSFFFLLSIYLCVCVHMCPCLWTWLCHDVHARGWIFIFHLETISSFVLFCCLTPGWLAQGLSYLCLSSSKNVDISDA